MILSAVSVFAQISPGDLTAAHQELEGMSNCTKCHELRKEVKPELCLDCHKELNSLIKQKRGYHVSSEVKAKKCVECHSEHNGRKFQIVRFDEKAFDHKLTGFMLTGKHKIDDCEKCHKPEFNTIEKFKERKKTFVGLSQDCKICHDDYHQGDLGTDCKSCHNTESFRPAPGFDHSKAKFVLTGAHVNTKCEGCHKKNMRNNVEFQAFKHLKFTTCLSCHKDEHKGKFGNNCEKCHSTASWHRIKTSGAFNHDLTNYPLRGMHSKVECDK